MGLMELPRTEPGQLIVTPHPMLLDGQRNAVWEARPGESLYGLLMRNVPELDGQPWAVSIGGVPVERHLWHCVHPKQGQVIEVRGGVGKSALMVVAMIALTYFTFGIGTAGGFVMAATGGALTGTVLAGAVFMAGSMLINKVLAPKQAKAGNQQQDSVYSISGARNQLRPYEPLPLLFGRVRITPDLLSKPYAWYEGNDQYLGLLLCAGVNVGRVEAFYNGDTVLSNYEGVQVYHAGYSQMPDQSIPLYSNADTVDGAELEKNGTWVERTTSADTVRIQINLEYMLGGMGGGGKGYDVHETIVAQYRAVGTTSWLPLVSQRFKSKKMDAKRATMSRDVARGQYEVRVHMTGEGNYSGGNTHYNDFQWTTLTSVQADDADYTGLSRTGVRIKATGQLNGSPDELRAVGYADPIPVWSGTSWVAGESSNPGAQILAYARGIRRGGRLLGGMALSDEQIDIESLKAFTLHCATNGYAYDYYIKDARNHEQVLSTIALAGFGQITWAGGRLGVVWAAQEQPLSGVVNMATIKKGQFQVDYNLSSAADGIEYTYLDAATWETKPLRVPAPGITTMLNPAQVAGEGVTSEAHAACLARWHLAQSLYQYKDIGYSTDIEHMSYQRLSLLAMQHDMTQWGFGGRVAAAINASGTVTLTLDEPVPAPASGNAYIGLRIPGERVYRVMGVRPFIGESNTVELLDPWPADAAMPGGTADNPAHDTLWVYDFKQTPGKRVRVVSIEPESDLKGAAVRVVEEGPEFWNYVLTGEYIPPPNESLLQTRPIASNLRITEQQVVQGDTVFTELTATFDITGPVGNILVLAAGQDQELLEVAQTQTRTATWRIPQADLYSIVVRPFSPDGVAGVAVSTSYATDGADVPPVLVDLFDVQERSGGVRQYTWGWMADTMRSADFAGVEIRYIAGNMAVPVWDDMTPVGDTGYHTAAFEAVVPESGQWTFACRSRNTSGALSANSRVVTVTLSANLGEQIGGIGQDLATLTSQQVAQQLELDTERFDRLQGDLETAAAAGADATAKANAARDAAIARVDALAGEIGEIVNAPEWQSTETYIAGWLVRESGELYRAKVETTGQQPSTTPAAWEHIGQFASAAEAAAAALEMATTNASNLAAETLKITSMQARMPVGNGALETKARVDQVDQARAEGDSALAQSINTVSTATNNAQSTASSALTAAGNAASAASIAKTTADNAQTTATAALNASSTNATAIQSVRLAPGGGVNLLPASALSTPQNWVLLNNTTGGSVDIQRIKGGSWVPANKWAFQAVLPGPSGAMIYASPEFDVTPGKRYLGSAYLADQQASSAVYLVFYNAAGVYVGESPSSVVARKDGGDSLASYDRVASVGVAPATARKARLAWIVQGTSNPPYAWHTQPMVEEATELQTQPSAWNESAVGLASATQELAVGIDSVDGRLKAKITNALDVNGNISGTVSENDGTRSSFSILASIFRVITNASTGLEWQNGYLRAYSSAIQLVLGINFGSANNLCFWYGPNVGATNCTKSNGTIWFDNTGSAYFGGSLSAGTKKNAVQTTTTITVGTELVNGPFNTNGGTRAVTISFSRQMAYVSNASGGGGFSAGSGSNTAVVQVYRKIGSAAESLWQTLNVGGTVDIANEPDAPDRATATWGGATTVNDISAASDLVTYRAVVTGYSAQSVTHPGTINSITATQNLSIISVEN